MDQQCFSFTKLDNNKSNNNNDNNLKSNIFCLCSILLIHINRGFLSHHVLHIQNDRNVQEQPQRGAESVSSLVLIVETCTFAERPVLGAARGTVCVVLHTAECIFRLLVPIGAPQSKVSRSAAASVRPLPGCKTFNDTYSDLNIVFYIL